MRISDWSSDVCSSDLLVLQALDLVVDLLQRPGRLQHVLAVVRGIEHGERSDRLDRRKCEVRRQTGGTEVALHGWSPGLVGKSRSRSAAQSRHLVRSPASAKLSGPASMSTRTMSDGKGGG